MQKYYLPRLLHFEVRNKRDKLDINLTNLMVF